MYTLKNLRRRSARTVLTIIGVSLAITLAIIMFSISEGIRESTDEIIERSGIEILVLPKGSDIFFGVGEFTEGRELAEDINSSNSQIAAAFPYLRERMYVTNNETRGDDEFPRVVNILVKGGTPEMSRVFTTSKLVKGTQLPTPGDPFYADGTYDGGTGSDNFTHEIVINTALADSLNLQIGDEIYISPQLPSPGESYEMWISNTTWFEVVGIVTQSFEDEGELSASVHLSELQYMIGKHKFDKADTIVVDLHDPSRSKEVKHWLENDYEDSDRITAVTQEDVRKEIERFTSTYMGFSEMVAGITIVVAILFVSTVIMISVKERTRELSALRALGFSRSSVFKLVLAEAVLVCLIGFAIGLVFGAVGTGVINSYAQSQAPELPEGFEIAKITPQLLVRALGSIILIGVLVGFVPAFWASRLNIIDALKSE